MCTISWISIMGYTAVMMTAPRTDFGMKLNVGMRKASAKRITPPVKRVS